MATETELHAAVDTENGHGRAAQTDRVEQLRAAHPLLFNCLTTEYGPEEARNLAIRRAIAGEPLRRVCAAIAVPYELRNVPVTGLRSPLAYAEISPAAARAVANRLEHLADPRHQTRAIEALFFGTALCDETFGMWLARPAIAICLPDGMKRARSLLFYAWCSRLPDLLPEEQSKLIWKDSRDWHTTLAIAQSWLDVVKFCIYFGESPIEDSWAAPYRAGRYEIVPLRTADELLDEASVMQNCLWRYAERLACQQCRLFSVRRSGGRIGTVEIVPGREGDLRIGQFRGPSNVAMDLEAWHVVHEWFASQSPQWNRHISKRVHETRRASFARLISAHRQSFRVPPGFWDGLTSIDDVKGEIERLKCTIRSRLQPSTHRHDLVLPVRPERFRQAS